jgi:hypothetical protein
MTRTSLETPKFHVWTNGSCRDRCISSHSFKILRFFLRTFSFFVIKTMRFAFPSLEPGTYKQFPHAVDVLKLRLDTSRIRSLLHSTPPNLLLSITYGSSSTRVSNTIEALKGIFLWESVLLASQNFGNSLTFDNSWKTPNCASFCDLLQENGQWKDIKF